MQDLNTLQNVVNMILFGLWMMISLQSLIPWKSSSRLITFFQTVGILLDKNDNLVIVPQILSGKINISGYQDWPKSLSHGIVPMDIATFVS